MPLAVDPKSAREAACSREDSLAVPTLRERAAEWLVATRGSVGQALGILVS